MSIQIFLAFWIVYIFEKLRQKFFEVFFHDFKLGFRNFKCKKTAILGESASANCLESKLPLLLCRHWILLKELILSCDLLLARLFCISLHKL